MVFAATQLPPLRSTDHDERPSNVAVGILSQESGDPDILERWFAEDGNVRTDPTVGQAILEFIRRYSAESFATER